MVVEVVNRLWPSAEDVSTACGRALNDTEYSPIADMIGYADVKWNSARLARRLKSDIDGGFFSPEPLLEVNTPETPVSFRPRTVASICDLAVIYAFLMKVGPRLDSKLGDGVKSYRWDAGSSGWDNGYLRSIKEAKGRYDYCVAIDVAPLREKVNVDRLRDGILSLSNGNGGSVPGAAESLSALFDVYRFWARGLDKPGNNGGGFSWTADGASGFLANFALVELDRAMANGGDDSRRKYVRFRDKALIFTKTKDEARKVIEDYEGLCRKGFGGDMRPPELLATSALTAGYEFPTDSRAVGDRVAAARDFIEADIFDGDLEKWGSAYFEALDVLGSEGDDSVFELVLPTFLHNPTASLLSENFRYLRRFAARFFFAGALVIALGRQSVRIPYHNYYCYRLGAYGREYSPALKELARFDAADKNLEWYWRLGAMMCLNSFDLSSSELDDIARSIEDEENPALLRAGHVLLRQRPAEHEDETIPKLSLSRSARNECLAEYFIQATTRRKTGRALLAEISETPAGSPLFIDRLHQLDLLKNNREVKDEFLCILDQKISECDLSWAKLLMRLEGIRNRRVT